MLIFSESKLFSKYVSHYLLIIIKLITSSLKVKNGPSRFDAPVPSVGGKHEMVSKTGQWK